ncbi:type I pullulanase [Lagierella sp.]|uniref:type I pullulanase n=1 Tax=Lagierella sp. TaxID=2849657 RepID=UPI00263598E8|nr:type I pullulanase [Lagierella sp.]
MDYNTIKDKVLGFEYSKDGCTFRVWSPVSKSVFVAIYEEYNLSERRLYKMTRDTFGVWEVVVPGDLNLKFYTYILDEKFEVTDPYSISASVNSTKSAIVDLNQTDPPGFKDHSIPQNKREDAIIYETHVKDFTYHESSGVKGEYRGKFLGIAEENTNYLGLQTGLDHLEDLGITHLHLMPIFDYLTVDETEENFHNPHNYNWGYDPELYNVPEGSYSLDPSNPVSRIKELKKMIMKVHEKGISVVMDVVYNHTYRSMDSNFNQLNPFYYYRIDRQGHFSNGSGCGNEFASEVEMGRKLIIDSLKYWVQEYKVDGFRFDLMALMDRETVDLIVKELRNLNPNILIYGEPWMAWSTTLPINSQTLPGSQKGRGFSIFNSDFRDAIKGDNDGDGKGYIQGEYSLKKRVQIGIMGSIISLDGYDGLTMYPMESINYFNSHDNLILADKLTKSLDKEDFINFDKITKMAFNIILLSLGLPFFHGGNEFSRSKFMEHNTYNSPISINQIDWTLKSKNFGVYNHVKNLIHFRREYKGYMLKSYDEMADSFYFIYDLPESVIAYTILGEEGMLLILHNCGRDEFFINWDLIFDHIKSCYGNLDVEDIELVFDEEAKFNKDFTKGESLKIPSITTYILRIRC